MKLILDVEECTGCKICELACSAKHQGIFNPKKAHLNIIDNYTLKGREQRLKSCTLCLNCVNVCPMEAISFNGKWLIIDSELCTGCQQCVNTCPQGIVHMNDDDKAIVPDFCEGKPICVEWCPHHALRQEE